MVGSQV